jgi:hypothetical protein
MFLFFTIVNKNLKRMLKLRFAVEPVLEMKAIVAAYFLRVSLRAVTFIIRAG